MTKLILTFVEDRVMLEVTIHYKIYSEALSDAEFPWVLTLLTCGTLFRSVSKSRKHDRIEVYPDDVKIKVDPVINRSSNIQTEDDFKLVNWTLKQLVKNLKIKSSCSGLIIDEYHAYQVI